MTKTITPTDTKETSFNRPMKRREMIKLGGTLATAGIAIPNVLAACGSSASKKTIRVYWSTGHMYDAYKKVVSKFEEDHQGWKVEMEPYQWADMRTKLLANLNSRSVPDLVEEPGGWVQEFSRTGKLLSLPDLGDCTLRSLFSQ